MKNPFANLINLFPEKQPMPEPPKDGLYWDLTKDKYFYYLVAFDDYGMHITTLHRRIGRRKRQKK